MTRFKRLARYLAAGSALALVAQAGVEHVGRQSVDEALRALAGPNGSMARSSVAVDAWTGRVQVEGLRLTLQNGTSIGVGSAQLPAGLALINPALAAENLTLNDVVIANGPVAVEIRKLDIGASAASRQDWMAALNGPDTTPLAARLAALSAETVSAPEIVIRVRVAGGSSTITYKDFRIAGLAKGLVRSGAVSGGRFEMNAAPGATGKGTFGPVSVTELDLPLIARAYLESAGPGDTAPKLAYATLSAEAIEGTAADGARYSARLMTAQNTKIRPTKTPLLPMLSKMAESKADTLTPAERAALLAAVVDALDAFELGAQELIELQVASPAGQDAVTVRMARMAYQGAQIGRPNTLQIDGLEIRGIEGSGRVGAISHTGWSYRPVIDALREIAAKGDFDPDAIDARRLIPELGTLLLRDIEIDTPDPSATSKDRIKLGIKGIEMAATDTVGGVPTAGRMAIDRFTMAIPPNADGDALKELLSLGYKELDVSSAFDARWIPATQDFSLNQLSAQGVNMGSIALRGVLGNVAKDAFDPDPTISQMGMIAATLKEARLTIENKGLFDRVVDATARKQQKRPDQLRKEISSMVQLSIPMMLGNSPASASIGSALSKFVAKPGRLVIAAKSRDPGGLTLMDALATGGDPSQILDLLDVTATAD